jgi:hypothetical protein
MLAFFYRKGWIRISRLPEEQTESSEETEVGIGGMPTTQIRVLDHDRDDSFALGEPQSLQLQRPRRTA